MKISELIKKLQKIQQEYGDLGEVRIAKNNKYFAFEEFDLTVVGIALYIG